MEQKLQESSGTTRDEQLYSTSATPLAVRSSTSTVPVRGSGLLNPALVPQGHTTEHDAQGLQSSPAWC